MERHVADALAGGAEVVTGGGRHALGGGFFQPTVLTGVAPGMLVTCEETFGPVAPVMSFRTEEEAVAIANDTRYGLAAYAYTRDIGRALRVGEALEAGTVGINTGVMSTEVAPAGGMKESGIGREGSHHGIDDFLELKYLLPGRVGPLTGGDATGGSGPVRAAVDRLDRAAAAIARAAAWAAGALLLAMVGARAAGDRPAQRLRPLDLRPGRIRRLRASPPSPSWRRATRSRTMR